MYRLYVSKTIFYEIYRLYVSKTFFMKYIIICARTSFVNNPNPTLTP